MHKNIEYKTDINISKVLTKKSSFYRDKVEIYERLRVCKGRKHQIINIINVRFQYLFQKCPTNILVYKAHISNIAVSV